MGLRETQGRPRRMEDALGENDIPDLLSPVAMARVDTIAMERALIFAFASAGSDVPLAEQLEHANLPMSVWDPASFEQDLYLEHFLDKLKTLPLAGQSFDVNVRPLLRVLSHPPAEPAVTHFRQQVLRELLQTPAWQQSFEQVYVKLQRFRALLRDAGIGMRIDANRRRLDILDAARSAVEEMANGFEGATSGLRRLRGFGLQLRASESYVRLSKVLELDESNSSLEARLKIGYDGELRHFEIVRISDQTLNPYYATRWGRIVRKLVLLFRGYRFSDSEVLNCFVDEVFRGVSGELVKLFQLMADMEFYLLALRFRDLSAEHGLSVCLPELASPEHAGSGQRRELRGLFNPLLLGPRTRPIACDLAHTSHLDTLILTGPNSGGKTRLLQALALTQLLAQSGFLVPAARAQLVWANGMFLSISDPGGADQREGRLGSELLRIRRVFESMQLGAFVVVDELCSGTNPVEGEEIFRMVIELLSQLHPQAFISTHFLQFASRLQKEHARGGLSFLQVELDARNLPTYQFVPGVASASLAQQTAARLGVTREELMALVDRQRRAHLPQRSGATQRSAVSA